jgi:hypothetical protein
MLHEPATVVTDFLLAGLAAWFAAQLRRSVPAEHIAARWWSCVLGLTAAASLTGGLTHGIGPELPAAAASGIWRSTLLLLNLTGAAVGLALLHALVPPVRQRAWRWVVVGKFLAFAAAAILQPKFVVALADYGLALLAWLVAALVNLRPWMLAAIALSVVAALVQQMQWGFGAQFNHNDVYHLIQAVGLWCFYRAALAEPIRWDWPRPVHSDGD